LRKLFLKFFFLFSLVATSVSFRDRGTGRARRLELRLALGELALNLGAVGGKVVASLSLKLVCLQKDENTAKSRTSRETVP
jgi:hypothetical protein